MGKIKPILFFAARWFLIYGLLILPWPGMKPLYAAYFQKLGQIVWAKNIRCLTLDFQQLHDPAHRWPANFDTAIIMSRSELTEDDGNDQRYLLTVDAWQMGWVPTAFFIALTLATPASWSRRRKALSWGILWMQVFVLMTLEIFIWNESTRLYPSSLALFGKSLANRLEELALSPVGPSFLAATLTWITVTFRWQELCKLSSPASNHGV